MSRVAIYARVSTADQSCDLQLAELRKYAAARGLEIVDSYVDTGVSGGTDNRPQLNRLMEDAHKRRFKAVLVWRFDRFGRSLRHLVTALATFQALGIDFISFSESIDTSTPTGKVLFAVISAFSEFERDSIRARVTAGIANARRKGTRLGRPTTVDTASIIALRKEGASYVQIQRKLGVSSGSIRRALKSAP